MKKINEHRASMFFGIILWCVVFIPLNAQWSTNPLVNNVISSALEGDQQVPVIISDGSGGAIITWEDGRNGGGNWDVYAQRIDYSGDVIWTTDGIPISTESEDQVAPTIISDGAGGAIITWKDSRSGFGQYDIYAQRINSSGVVQWTTDGVAICTVAGTQEDQTITSDGSGGAIITWEDQRSGSGAGYKIYAQRINASGVVQWTTNGVAVCSNLSGSRQLPTIAGDGSGGAIITWSDNRSLSNYDIYAQRINASGDSVWTGNGVAICTFATNQGKPKIVTDGTADAIISWIDERTTNGDVYAQRINSSGVVQWTANGVVICSQPPFIQSTHNIINDGSGGAIITWQDNRNGNFDIYAQKVNASGAVQWAADGIAECAAADNQYFPAIVSDGAGGAIISWHDNRLGTSSYDIYAQKINSSGAAQWTTDGAAVCTNGSWQGYTSITGDGASGAIITWYDYRNGLSNIYASQINANGSLGAGPLPVEIVSFSASNIQHAVELKWKTATEVNNYGFEIERCFVGRLNLAWEKVGFVEGSGTTNAPRQYSFTDKNSIMGKYLYRLKQIDRDGKFEYSQSVEVESSSPPKEFALEQNYPNPFNPATIISYQLPSNGFVSLKVYDMLGQVVAILVNEIQEAGENHIEFKATQYPSGMYFYTLRTNNFNETKKMLLVK